MRLLVLAAVVPLAVYADETPVVATCIHPAKLETFTGGGRVESTIFLKHGTREALLALMKKYKLTGKGVAIRSGLLGLSVPPLTTPDLAAIRCDPDVELVAIWHEP